MCVQCYVCVCVCVCVCVRSDPLRRAVTLHCNYPRRRRFASGSFRKLVPPEAEWSDVLAIPFVAALQLAVGTPRYKRIVGVPPNADLYLAVGVPDDDKK